MLYKFGYILAGYGNHGTAMDKGVKMTREELKKIVFKTHSPLTVEEVMFSIDKYVDQIRAEVIEEFVKAIEKHQTRQDSYLDPPYVEMGLDMTDVLEVAEQLKERNEQNSIIEALKPRGCTDMPKDIKCNCTKEEFVYPEAYNEPFDEAIKRLKEQK